MLSHLRSKAQLTCSVCGQTYDEPRILPCLHTFCTKCIEGLDAFVPSLPSARPAASDARSAAATLAQSLALNDCFLTLDSTGDSAISGYETEKSPTVSTGSLSRIPGCTTGSLGTLRLDCQRPTVRHRTILCPTCDSEVDLPPGGPAHLPLHYVLQNKSLVATLNFHDTEARCELCVGEIRAVSWCVDCRVGICAFCSEAHKRQRMTGRHRVLALEEAKHRELTAMSAMTELSIGDLPWPVCLRHPTEELRLFCDTCGTTVCRDCCVPGGEHRGHRARFVGEVAEEKIGDLRNLLAHALPRAEDLRAGLAGVRSMAKKVSVQQAQVCLDVDSFVDDYVKAVEAHRRNLLERVRNMCEIKQRILKLQSIQLEQALEDVDTLCAFVEQLLREGSDVEILALLGHVAKRLEDLGTENHRLDPMVDDFLVLAKDEVAGRVNGFSVRGALTTQKLCPAKCVLKANGESDARQGQKINVTLVTKDTEGLPMRKGGHNPRVELVSRDDANKIVAVKTVDRKDGTYSISLAPEESGLYWLNVTFHGNHIQGSPYPIPIKAKWVAHSGSFHCCTFCSSGGDKKVACGCGGTMPGGFKGCGHGHNGHPGKRHWSCCGIATENSECNRPMPKTYEFTI